MLASMRHRLLWAALLPLSCVSDDSIGVGGNALTVSISGPSMDSVVTNGSLTLQVAVSGEPTTVELYREDARLASLQSPYTFVWDTSKEAEGSYTLRAKATRPGAAATSAPKRITVDRTGPKVERRLPADAAANVYLADALLLEFNEPVAAASVTEATVQIRSGTEVLARETKLDSTGTKLSIQLKSLPTAPEWQETYTVALNGVTDEAGNTLGANTATFRAPQWQGFDMKPLDVDVERPALRPTMVVDAAGRAVVAWLEFVSATQYELLVKRWNPEKAMWDALGSAVTGKIEIGGIGKGALALAKDGQPLIAFTESSPQTSILVKQFDGATWTALGAKLNSAQDAKDVTLITDPVSGAPVVAWSEAGDIIVKRWSGTIWEPVGGVLDALLEKTADSPALAINSKGKPVVAWREQRPGDSALPVVYVKTLDSVSNTWVAIGGSRDALASPFDANVFSVALGLMEDNPIVGWLGLTIPREIYTRRFNGANFLESDPVGASARSPFGAAFAFASTGPFVAWFDDDPRPQQLRVAQRLASGWKQFPGELNVNPNNAALYPAIALEANKHPIVAWHENVGGTQSSNIYAKRLNHLR
jgi:hypothetical protein